MKLFESKMTGIVYNKNDAETWRVIPKFSETKGTSYLDVNDLVLVDEKFLTDGQDNEIADVDINGLFDELNCKLNIL